MAGARPVASLEISSSIHGVECTASVKSATMIAMSGGLLACSGAILTPAHRSRREVLQTAALPVLVAPVAAANAVTSPSSASLQASWTATAGFSDASFIRFDEGAYKAMVDDERRTPLFEKAIRQRLAGTSDAVVVDLGTGPFAVLALSAARAGARKVYAIEASPEAARLARKAVSQATDLPISAHLGSSRLISADLGRPSSGDGRSGGRGRSDRGLSRPSAG